MRTQALTILLFLTACDTAEPTSPRETTARGGDWSPNPPDIRPSRRDCRDAHFCYRDCLGAAWLGGTDSVDVHEVCADECTPEVLWSSPAGVELHQWDFWIAAVETQCEDDWTDDCLWNAVIPDLHGDGGDLSGTVLDACLRPRW